MKVILLKTLANLGQKGQIKDVAEGYGRNFLLPQGLAKVANERNVKEMELAKQKIVKVASGQVKKFKELAKKIDNIKIIIQAKADEKKTLFGSVNAAKIAEELKKRNYEVEAKYIKLEQPIKSLGYYDVMIDFGSGVLAKVGLTITREE
jgi:large subunit ribosomal protein L9